MKEKLISLFQCKGLLIGFVGTIVTVIICAVIVNIYSHKKKSVEEYHSNMKSFLYIQYFMTVLTIQIFYCLVNISLSGISLSVNKVGEFFVDTSDFWFSIILVFMTSLVTKLRKNDNWLYRTEKRGIYISSILGMSIVYLVNYLIWGNRANTILVGIISPIALGFCFSLDSLLNKEKFSEVLQDFVKETGLKEIKERIIILAVPIIVIFIGLTIEQIKFTEHVSVDLGILLGAIALILFGVIYMRVTKKKKNKPISNTIEDIMETEIRNVVSSEFPIYNEEFISSKDGAWALLGRDKNKKWICVQVGYSNNIKKDIQGVTSLIEKERKSIFEVEYYKNSFGESVEEIVKYPSQEEQLYAMFSKKYKFYKFIVLSTDKATKSKKKALYFADSVKPLYWTGEIGGCNTDGISQRELQSLKKLAQKLQTIE